MRTFWIVAAALALAGCGSTGVQPEQFNVEIVDFGILEFAEESETGINRLTSLKQADTIPFIRGTEYGIVYRVSGEPADARIQLKLQPIVTGASAQQGKRQLGKLYRPLYRMHNMGDVRAYSTTVGFYKQPRRPFDALLMVLDMNGKVLAKKNFTVVDKDTLDADPLAQDGTLSEELLGAWGESGSTVRP